MNDSIKIVKKKKPSKLISSLLLFLLIFLVLPTYSGTRENKIRIVKEDAVLLLKPDNSSLIIKKLPVGSEFKAEETIREWVKISLPPDKDGIVITGYVHISFVSFESKPLQPEPEKKIELPTIKDYEYISWEKKLASEKSKKSTGLVLGLVSAAILIPSVVLTFTDKKEEVGFTHTAISYEEKIKTIYIIGDAVGLIGFAAGISIHFAAVENVKQLEQEGKRAGYISFGLLPKFRAVGIQINISF